MEITLTWLILGSLFYVPLAGIVMLAQIRERRRMELLYKRSVIALRLASFKRRR